MSKRLKGPRAENQGGAVPAEEPTGGAPFYLVNPQGCVHECDRDHAAARLREAGWRMATSEEVAAYAAAQGYQRFDRPLAAPWTASPEA